MLRRVAAMLWGEFDSSDELKKFIKLSVVFFLVIAVYWTLRPIKDSVFGSIIGGKWLPWAKMLSITVIAPLVVLYIKLIERYAREKVFYGLLSVYSVLTILFALAFMHPTIVQAFMDQDCTVVGPWCAIGWLWYVFVESFGSLVIALFWVITTDITLPESAKRGFPIIALFGQLGNIFGPFILNTRMLGLTTSAPIVAICALLMGLILVLMKNFMDTTPAQLLVGYHSQERKTFAKKETEFFEGLRLLYTQKYLMGIFLLVSVYEIIITIIDNHFKQTVYAMYASEAARSAYLSSYAYCVGIVASICIFLGINNIQRYLGIQVSLILLPILIGVVMILTACNPTSLSMVFTIMVTAKAINYAINQPTLKQLYIPTTQEYRHKSQGWIEMFGSRSAKGLASAFNTFRGGSLLSVESFLVVACFISFGFIAVWCGVAFFVANKYNTAVSRNEVVC